MSDRMAWAAAIRAPLPPRPRDPRPPLWHATVITVMTIPATVVGGLILGLVLAIVMVASGSKAFTDPEAVDFPAFLETPMGLLAILIPGQLIFAVAGLIGAKVARAPWRQTLGFTAPQPGMWILPLLVVASFPIVFSCITSIEFLLPEWLLKEDLFSKALDQAHGGETAILIAALSLMPGLVEEMLFRGYLQRRLLIFWPPWAAILLSTAMFAIAHMSLQTVFVVPLGLWLGFIAWRTGSIWHTIFVHAGYNATIFAMHLLDRANIDLKEQMPGVLIVSTIALIASIIMLVMRGCGSEPLRRPFLPAAAPIPVADPASQSPQLALDAERTGP